MPELGDKPLTTATTSSGVVGSKSVGNNIIKYALTVIIILASSFLIQHFLIGMYTVSTGSMEPTYHGCQTNTDNKCTRLIVFKQSKAPNTGDTIVFNAPHKGWGDHIVLTKRVIAVGGQRISCSNTGNNPGVLVDGNRIPENYLDMDYLKNKYGNNLNPCLGAPWEPVVVPEDGYFVMGDDRGNSKDSRAFVKDSPNDSTVSKRDIIGIVVGSFG